MNRKRILMVLFILCLAGILLFADPGATKPWTWANRLSSDDIETATLWLDVTSEYTLTAEETEELVTLLNGLNRFDFKENKHLQGSTPTSGFTLWIGGEPHHLGYYGIFEMSYGDSQWWIRDDLLDVFINSLEERI